MDRQATLGFILIALVLIVWMMLNAPPPPQRENPTDPTELAPEITREEPKPPAEIVDERQVVLQELGRFFEHAAQGEEKVLMLETDLYRVEITTRGALVRKWELKKYRTWDQLPVQLVEFDRGGDFSLLFNTTDGKQINTRNLFFDADFEPWEHVVLTGDESSYSVDLVVETATGGRIVKTLTFTNGRYSFEADLHLEKMHNVIAGFEYQVVWETGLRFSEYNSIDEASFAYAYAYAGKELVELDAKSDREMERRQLSGTTDWVATRTKYFALALIPRTVPGQGAYLEGIAQKLPDDGLKKSYGIALRMPYRNQQDARASFTVFLGPLEYDVIREYGVDLEKIMSLGAAWIIRPISEWFIIPLFRFLRSFIPNFGVVIILFSIIIKILLHPLTKTSMKAMKKMQALQPMMEEIRQKYKDDPQKMNRQIMQLYKDYGVNPAGGCLPLLLQLPILYALWTVFRSAIELRQASFVWWIKDLSVPDVIFTLPGRIPLFGIDEVSGLALLMGITLFFQQKMTIKDPRQKMMVWLMPILLTLLFNGFPSGLNLYYFVFNLLSIGQQLWFNKKHNGTPLKKVEARKRQGGIMNRITKNMPKMKR